MQEVFPPEVAELIAPLYQLALNGETSEIDVAFEGRIFTQTLGPLYDEVGNVVAGVGFTRDVTAARRFEAEMAQQSRRLRDAESIGQVGLWDLNLRNQAVSWSKGIFDLYGMDYEDFAGDYSSAVNVIHPDDRAKANSGIEACVADGVPFRVTYRINRARDGELRWIDSRGEAVYEDGERVWIVGAIADVTERVEAQAQAQADQALRLAVIEASPDVIFISDVTTRSTTWSNRPLWTILGHTDEPDGGASLSIDDFIPDDERDQFSSAIAAATRATPGEVISINHRLTAADGSDRWFSRRITALRRDDDGQVTELVNVLRDISDAVAAEQQLRHSAMHDNLTGLPNRALLMDRLDGALSRMERNKREISVLFCDLDGFKRINDTAGHSAGDQALMETARRLQEVVRDGDTVARIGGDEFVLIIEPWNRNGDHDLATADHDRAAGISVADRIRESMRSPVKAFGVDHQSSVSIGVAFATYAAGQPRGMTAGQLLLDADAAMYRAKGRGKDRFEVFQEGMRTDGAQRSQVEQLLRQVLLPDAAEPSVGRADGAALPRLSVAYQPIFSSSPRALVGFEALARLVDAQGFTVAPDVFIPIAEETGIVGGIDVFVLDLACRQLAAWRADVPEMAEISMSVNVSALHAQHAALTDDVHRALRRHGLAPKDLMLELTESSLLSAAHSTIASLRRLPDEGLGIAIDDFGTGYASLRYLATLPISSLKIDRSFTAGLPLDRTCQKIVNAVAGLAADLQLSCVVEGVETDAQHDSLPAGVNVQGFLTGPPQHPDVIDLRRWLTPRG